MSEALLRASGVTVEKGYRRLLAGVDLEVHPGQLWQLAGANGVGKTSLLRAFAGLSRFGIEGDLHLPEPPLYQGHLPALKPLLTPVENLAWHPSGGITSDMPAIEAALSEVGLAGYEQSPLHTLSAGQQRRVGLARLWLSQAALWLLDEPFTAIDIRGADLLERRLIEHADSGGAVVFTSHQPNRFGDRLNLLDLAHHAA